MSNLPFCKIGTTIPYCKQYVNVYKSGRGFQIGAMVPPAMSDDPFETIFHRATFLTREAAESFAEKLRKGKPTGQIHPFGKHEIHEWIACLDYWTWTPSNCSSYGFMHTRPAI